MENQDFLKHVESLFANQNTLMKLQFDHVKEKIDGLATTATAQGLVLAAQDKAINAQDRRLIKVEQKASLFTKLGYAALISIVVSAVATIFGKHS